MWIETLHVCGLRCIADSEFSLAPRLNLLLGPNGAGKTSVLEAAYLISHGRSFRPGSRDTLIQRGANALQVFARVQHEPAPRVQRLGLERRAGAWSGRLDERPLERLTDLFRACAVCCFEPGSHDLVVGASENRRAFLDWGVFHVEREFLADWRHYQSALKQRNSSLKQDASEAELDAWDAELERWGDRVTKARQRYLDRFQSHFRFHAKRLLPELDGPQIQFFAGWEAEMGIGLAAQLRVQRDRDRQRQLTGAGPHRADWRPTYAGHRGAELSRGQAKLTALAAVLAQARAYQEAAGQWPVLLIDDLPSELDPEHQGFLLTELAAAGAQTLITATDWSPALRDRSTQLRLFHVERGVVRPIAEASTNDPLVILPPLSASPAKPPPSP